MRVSRRNFLGSSGLGAIGVLGGCSENASGDRTSHNTEAVRNSPLDGIGRENIQITDVKVRLFSCDYPIKKWWYGAGVTILTEIFTNQGIIGIGGPSPYAGPEFVKEYTEKHIKPQLIGKNPFDVEIIAPSHRERNKAMAWAGVNVACWDIIGKAKNKPIYELLATNTEPVTHIKHYASCGTIWDFDKRPEDLIDEALGFKEEGFYGFKFRFAEHFEKNMTISKYLPFLEKLRLAVGDNFDLIHEFNMRIPIEQGLELVPKLAELKFQWVEEPVDRWGRPRPMVPSAQEDLDKAIDWHMQIREVAGGMPISGGETMTDRLEFKDWIEQSAYDIVQPDCDTTGLSEGWYIAQLAHLHNKPCVPHNWHGDLTWMSNIHLVAAIPNRMVLESCRHYNPFRGGLFKEPIVVKDSFAEVPTGPGLGVEIIDDADKKFPYDPSKHWLKTQPSWLK